MNRKLLISTLFSFALAVALPEQSIAQAQPGSNESQLIEHGQYTNRDGQTVHSPAHSANGAVPAGATAHCRDGTYSFSKHRSGTCSGHHGVAEWL